MLGRHDGIIHFTVGQRRGLGVAAGEPLYVVRLDAAHAPRRGRPARGAAHAPMRLRDVNWIGDGTLDECSHAGAARGFRQGALDAAAAAGVAARAARGGVEVELVDGEDGVAPGQACVFYDARRRAGARARRRLHPERGRDAAHAAPSAGRGARSRVA